MDMMADHLDPVAVVNPKRARVSINWNLCIFCQKQGEKSTSSGGTQGIQRVKDAFAERLVHTDSSGETIRLLEPHIDDLASKEPVWHKSCYAAFTSKLNLQRLSKTSMSDLQPATSNVLADSVFSGPTTRTDIPQVDWSKCIFCQSRKREKVIQVQTLDVDNTIKHLAAQDHRLKCRIGENDLIAYEAHYHKSCRYQSEKGATDKASDRDFETDRRQNEAWQRLVEILDFGFQQGHIFLMNVVVNKYRQILSSLDIDSESMKSNTLKLKLQNHYGDKITLKSQRNPNEPSLVYPSWTVDHSAEALKDYTESLETEQCRSFAPLGPTKLYLQSLRHVSTKLRTDLLNTPGLVGYNFSRNDAESCIPDSLYTLLKWTFCDSADEETEALDPEIHQKILNVGQDFVYAFSRGRKNTPKQIATGMLVHHVTRSKLLVDYLHAGGDSIGYDTVLRIDTSIATAEIRRFVNNDMVFVPENIHEGQFAQFAADNLDIIEETLDGKGTFHVTQLAVFQRGPAVEKQDIGKTVIGREKALNNIPDEFHQLVSVEVPPNHVPPKLSGLVRDYTFSSTQITRPARLKDTAFILSRMKQSDRQVVPAWTGFNQTVSRVTCAQSIIGYLPIIPAPAHEMDTLMTVLLRCKDISRKLSQSTTVITFDQALYYRAKELVWLCPDKLSDIIVRLGSFHIAMNFLGVIGQHMADSGLTDVWIESNVFGECTAEKIMKGKFWNRAVRGHKLMYEALRRLLMEKFILWLHEQELAIFDEIEASARTLADAFSLGESQFAIANTADYLMAKLDDFQAEFDAFVQAHSDNQTFLFWKQYVDLVDILLLFIRAEREGNWDLHLAAFQNMMPLMVLYDHTNYTRWGTIYILDMLHLENTCPHVHREFQAGNFVVKEAEGSFNQVSTDMALEHVNRMCKSAGGLVGITQTKSALDRWMLTCCDRAQLVEDAQKLVGQTSAQTWTQKEKTRCRMQRDEEDVRKILTKLRQFNTFERDRDDLICISTNDVVPSDRSQEMLSARERGTKLWKEFVETRLGENATISMHDKIKLNKAKTFSGLYDIRASPEPTKASTLKQDRNLFRRLLSAAHSGRDVDLPTLLTHELHPTPPSLATIDGQLHSTNKAVLSHVLASSTELKQLPTSEDATCVIIDGMAVVQAIGKPKNAKTFGDLADVFSCNVLSNFANNCKRIDLVFDRYNAASVKSATRRKRTDRSKKIQRLIDRRDVLLPSSWSNFIGLTVNKQNLIHFLTTELLSKTQDLDQNRKIIIAGGSDNPEKVVMSSPGQPTSLPHLFTSQEEADTRMVLHVVDASQRGYHRVVVQSRDTDVLLLLLHHKDRFSANVWMSAGTSKTPRFIPIHEVHRSLSPDVVAALPAYHAITGCDTTSQFSGYGKRSTWQTFVAQPDLLGPQDGTGRFDMSGAEKYVMNVYCPSACSVDINSLRLEMFHRVADMEKLPPTRDALTQHLLRCQYQCIVWCSAHIPYPDIPSAEESGWKYDQQTMTPILMTRDPMPISCPELVTCKCTKSKCSSTRCGCVKIKMGCSLGCVCAITCLNPNNPDNSHEETDSDED